MLLTTPNPIRKWFGPKHVRFSDISLAPKDAAQPMLDRDELGETPLTEDQTNWRRDGILIKRGFLPDAVIDPYVDVRRPIPPGGWQTPTPYQHVPALRDLALYPPLMALLKHLLGEDLLLHLALTGWISTKRDWHQDAYLNPGFVGGWYVAVWMALDTIHPDSGPFEYVLGSHRWPVMDGKKVRSFLTREELRRIEPTTGANQWEATAERFITPAVEAEIERRGSRTASFLAEKGDILIWHSRMMHRGSMPRVMGLERCALITHYSGVNHRPDMPRRKRDSNGEHYALFDQPLRI